MRLRFYPLLILGAYAFVFLTTYLYKLFRDAGTLMSLVFYMAYYFINPIVLILASWSFIFLAHRLFGVKISSVVLRMGLYVLTLVMGLYIGILYQHFLGKLFFGALTSPP